MQQVFSRFKPTIEEIRNRTLDEYERSLLEQEAAAAYHRKLVEYYRDGIARLKAYQPSWNQQEATASFFNSRKGKLWT